MQKFNPTLPSFIFALNQSTKKEDLELISAVTKHKPAELIGIYKGEYEFSYQIPLAGLDMQLFHKLMKDTKQISFIEVQNTGNVTLHGQYVSYDIGHMQPVRATTEDSLICLESLIQFKAVKQSLTRSHLGGYYDKFQ